MKKLLAGVLVVLFVLGFTACGNQKDKPFQVDIFWGTFSDEYLKTVRSSVGSKLNGFVNLEYTMHDCRNDQSLQNDYIAQVMSRGTDLFIVNVVSPDDANIPKFVDKASEKDIPVIFFGREVSDEIILSYDKCVYIGTDPNGQEDLLGEHVFEVISKNFDEYDLNGDDSLQYVIFKDGLADMDTVVKQANKQFEEDEMGTLVAIEKDQVCDGTAEDAKSKMAAIIDQFPMGASGSVEVVICSNVEIAEGVIEALNDVEWNEGDSKSTVAVFSIGGGETARTLIYAYKMSGTIQEDSGATAAAIVSFIRASKDGTSWYGVLETFDDVENNKILIPYSKFG